MSYTWGTGNELEKNHTIILDGQPFYVTQKVFALLHEWRSYSPWPLILWIDSICIDQSNREEKDHQNPIMKEIYQFSLIVLAYLGTPIEEDERIMHFIKRLTWEPYITRSLEIMEWINAKSKAKAQEAFLSRLRAFMFRKYYSLLSISCLFLGKIVHIIDHTNSFLTKMKEFERGKKHADEEDMKQMEAEVQELKAWEPTAKGLRLAETEDFSKMAQMIGETFASRTKYFSRMWTLQEGVAGIGLGIRCGGQQIGDSDLAKTVFYLSKKIHCGSYID